MIKNYIFDFGNVLTEFYPDKLTAPFVSHKETQKYLSEIVFDRIYWDRLDEGSLSDTEAKKEICSRLPLKMHDVACKVFDNWIKNLTPIKGMQQLVSDIHNIDKRLYLLSNISISFAEKYHSVGWIDELFSCFDGLVFSGKIGKVKPNRDIFEYLLDKYNLKPEECLFIDDSIKNLEGAKRMGIKGYLFDGDADKLRAFLGM